MRGFVAACALIMLVSAGAAAQPQSSAERIEEPQSGRQLPQKPEPKKETAQIPPAQAPTKPHAFWDKRNAWLFASVGAMRALDYHSTRNMRRRGRDEILLSNAVVDNRPLFVAVEAAGTVASIGLSYLFHRTNHHKLERWVSIVHIGVAGVGSVRNYCLESRRVPSAPP